MNTRNKPITTDEAAELTGTVAADPLAPVLAAIRAPGLTLGATKG